MYHGKVNLVKELFKEKQKDKNGKLRDVWIFPLQLEKNVKPINSKVLVDLDADRSKKTHRLSDEAVKKVAKGICDLCGCNALFINKNKEPYLEVHHIIWLFAGGKDTVDNVAALCPNCHCKMHSLNLTADITILKKRL